MLKIAFTYVIEHREIELGLIWKLHLYWPRLYAMHFVRGKQSPFSPSYELCQLLETWLQGTAFSWWSSLRAHGPNLCRCLKALRMPDWNVERNNSRAVYELCVLCVWTMYEMYINCTWDVCKLGMRCVWAMCTCHFHTPSSCLGSTLELCVHSVNLWVYAQTKGMHFPFPGPIKQDLVPYSSGTMMGAYIGFYFS